MADPDRDERPLVCSCEHCCNHTLRACRLGLGLVARHSVAPDQRVLIFDEIAPWPPCWWDFGNRTVTFYGIVDDGDSHKGQLSGRCVFLRRSCVCASNRRRGSWSFSFSKQAAVLQFAPTMLAVCCIAETDATLTRASFRMTRMRRGGGPRSKETKPLIPFAPMRMIGKLTRPSPRGSPR